jgi:hypothetical protein
MMPAAYRRTTADVKPISAECADQVVVSADGVEEQMRTYGVWACVSRRETAVKFVASWPKAKQ